MRRTCAAAAKWTWEPAGRDDEIIRAPIHCGSLWTEESWRGLDEKSNERAYVACSFHVANPGNWVFTPFIPRESANILYINVLYNTRSCDQYHDPKSCKETFNLYVKQYDRKVNDVDKETFNRTISTWSPVSVLTKDTTAVISETTQAVALQPNTKFVRFGFEENGVCVSLLTITVSVFFSR
ncbi:ephrin receptor ligand binding domain protein [Ancylostoma duodenale]|uniref:Ephrin receptor ligand binding domain protein n=1 Tax=Ancylostoma duodenale TaxID=51022 RepID=A0A0C2CNN9_9BILA|nr:ephrin receptor ligand binding domain protein [Ancylostoma duodenale]